MLEEESDEELRELAKEELNDSKAKVEELEKKLKILLLPKDRNGGGMNPPAGLCFRHPLHTVDAGLIFHNRIGSLSGYHKDLV